MVGLLFALLLFVLFSILAVVLVKLIPGIDPSLRYVITALLIVIFFIYFFRGYFHMVEIAHVESAFKVAWFAIRRADPIL